MSVVFDQYATTTTVRPLSQLPNPTGRSVVVGAQPNDWTWLDISRGVSFSFTRCLLGMLTQQAPALWEAYRWHLYAIQVPEIFLKYYLVMSHESSLVGYSSRRIVATPKRQLYLKLPGVLQTLCGLGCATCDCFFHWDPILKLFQCAMIF